jgi:hypothetical protein
MYKMMKTQRASIRAKAAAITTYLVGQGSNWTIQAMDTAFLQELCAKLMEIPGGKFDVHLFLDAIAALNAAEP